MSAASPAIPACPLDGHDQHDGNGHRPAAEDNGHAEAGAPHRHDKGEQRPGVFPPAA